jgi:hypothetical protein
MSDHDEISALREKVQQLEKDLRRQKALTKLACEPDFPPCFNCKRIVLAGKCCDGPHTAEQYIEVLTKEIETLTINLATVRETAKNRIEALRFIRDDWSEYGARACPACVYVEGKFIRSCKIHEALDKAQKRVEMLQAEVEMLRGVGCSEDGDGPCGVCIKCYKNRFEATVKLVRDIQRCTCPKTPGEAKGEKPASEPLRGSKGLPHEEYCPWKIAENILTSRRTIDGSK